MFYNIISYLFNLLYKKRILWLQSKHNVPLKKLIKEKKRKIFCINIINLFFLMRIIHKNEKKRILFVTNDDKKEIFIKKMKCFVVKMKDLKNLNKINEAIHAKYKLAIKNIYNENSYQSMSYIEYIDLKFAEYLLELYPNHHIFFIKETFFLKTQKIKTNFDKNLICIKFLSNFIVKFINIFVSFFLNIYNKFIFKKKKYDLSIVMNVHNKSPILNAYKSIENESKKLNINILIITGSIKFFIKNFMFRDVVFLRNNYIKKTTLKIDKTTLKKYFNRLFFKDRYSFSQFYKRFLEKENIEHFLNKNIHYIPKNIIFLPHIGQIQDAFFSLQKTNAFVLSSAPLMTISSSVSSTVDWGFLNIIGSYGDISTESFILNDVPISKIINIGNMSYDLLNENKKNNKKRIILIATSSYCKNEIEWIEKIIQVSCEIKNIQIIISLHPSFRKNLYINLEKKYSKNIVKINDKKDSEYYLKKCDICFTDFSSVGALSIFMKKKLIVVNLSNDVYPSNNFDQMKVAFLINHIDEITPQKIELYLNSKFDYFCSEKYYNKFIKNYNYYNDGKAAFRFLNHLLKK